MKKLNLFYSSVLFSMLLISSCSLFEENINPEDTVAKEGNMWQASATGYPEVTATVTQNDEGVATISVNYDGIDYTFKGKVSEKKIEDYVYSNGDESKPFTLCDFDAEVGDTWEYNIGNQTVVREVTYKSTEDDTFLGAMWLMVKVTEVTETIPEGITVAGYPAEARQIVWSFNHKFGFVRAEVMKSDNSTITIGLTDTNIGTDQ
jgi:hypothetical protein